MAEIYHIRDGADSAEWFNRTRADMNESFQARFPAVTQATLESTWKNLEQAQMHYNEFTDALINRIGLVIAQQLSWENPLKNFKSGTLTYGDQVEEYGMDLFRQHVYDPDRNYMEKAVWGQERNAAKSIFHKINRQNYYKGTLNREMLRRAFLSGDGVQSYLTSVMQALTTSDNQDEFIAMTKLFSAYENNYGFFKMQVPDVAKDGSTAEDAKAVLRKLRAAAQNLTFLNTDFNAKHMPSYVNRDDLMLVTTPEFSAAVDVEALAASFNVDYANFASRTVTIPKQYLGIDGCQAILTGKSFFRIWDTLFMTTTMPNPVGLYTNVFLHRHQIISNSLFTNAIMFTTKAGSNMESITVYVPTALSIFLSPMEDGTILDKVAPGMIVHVDNNVTTTPTSDDTVGVVYSITGNTSNKTYITREGNLHVAVDEKATTITVNATTITDNPTDTEQTATLAVTIGIPADIDANEPDL